MPFSLTITDPRDLDDRQLLLVILERLDTMSQAVTDNTAEETVLAAKVDQLLAAFAAGKTQLADLQAQIAALQAQIAQGVLTAADQSALAASLADMQAKATAIDAALTPPATPSHP